MKALGYVAIHKDKLLPAAYLLLQRRLGDIQRKQNDIVDKELTSWNPWRPKGYWDAAKKLDKEPGQWQLLKYDIMDARHAYRQLQTACQMSEGYVYLDIAVVHKLFGE